MNNLKINIKFKTKKGETYEYPIIYNYINGKEEVTLTAEIIDKIKQSEFDEPVTQDIVVDRERVQKDIILEVLKLTEAIRQEIKTEEFSDVIMILQYGIQIGFGISDKEVKFLKGN